jgi:16S rRNA (uracil1498-N3)-methyltransferase
MRSADSPGPRPEAGFRRYWAARVDLEGGRVWLDPAEARHVRTVLRHKPGDTIEVIDGSGRRFDVELSPPGHAGLEGRIVAVHPPEPEPPPLLLVVPMIRWPRLEELLGGAVQLGATSIVFWSAAHGTFEEPLTAGRKQRLEHIVRAATTQSLGLRLPRIAGPCRLEALIPMLAGLAVWVAHGPLPVADRSAAALRSGTPPPANPPAGRSPGGQALVVGPEGGLRDEEVAALVGAGAAILDLGPRRLRTEVAALAGLALLTAPGFRSR